MRPARAGDAQVAPLRADCEREPVDVCITLFTSTSLLLFGGLRCYARGPLPFQGAGEERVAAARARDPTRLLPGAHLLRRKALEFVEQVARTRPRAGARAAGRRSPSARWPSRRRQARRAIRAARRFASSRIASGPSRSADARARTRSSSSSLCCGHRHPPSPVRIAMSFTRSTHTTGLTERVPRDRVNSYRLATCSGTQPTSRSRLIAGWSGWVHANGRRDGSRSSAASASRPRRRAEPLIACGAPPAEPSAPGASRAPARAVVTRGQRDASTMRFELSRHGARRSPTRPLRVRPREGARHAASACDSSSSVPRSAGSTTASTRDVARAYADAGASG